MAEIQLLSDLMLGGALVMGKNETGFPENPRIGTFIVKDECLYCYIKLGGLETWYPFASKTNSHIHSQGLPSLEWIVNHNLGTSDVWFQVKDPSGNVLNVGKEDINENSFKLRFTTAATGRVVVVGPDNIQVPQMKASYIEAGGGRVVIDADGIRINGENVLTNAIIADQIDAAVHAQVDPLTAVVTQNQTDAQAALAARYTKTESDTLLATKSDIGHVHTVANVTGLRAELDALSQLISDLDATYATDADIAGKVAAINTAWASADSSLQGFVDALGSAKADKTQVATDIASAVSAIKGAVAVEGDTLAKLHGLVTTLDGEFDAHNHNAQYEPKSANIQLHIADHANPHGTNKVHVGLSEVDNTSDANKPVSTLQQQALNGKADKADTYTKAEVDAAIASAIAALEASLYA